MHSLSESGKTREYLEVWAGAKPLLFVPCFFWMAGSSVQKSLNGMLRSLLHDILMKAPLLVPRAAQWRWQAVAFSMTLPQWTNSELIETFRCSLEACC